MTTSLPCVVAPITYNLFTVSFEEPVVFLVSGHISQVPSALNEYAGLFVAGPGTKPSMAWVNVPPQVPSLFK